MTDVRRRIGMVFQKPNPFPAMTISENVLSGLRSVGIKTKDPDGLVEDCLTRAGLWNEVKNRLDRPGGALSGGQQQRLCIARSLAVDPQVLLMDEPCSALDPTSTRRIEDTMHELEQTVTIVIVTHNMQQAQRVADFCAFFNIEEGESGRIVESGTMDKIFNEPRGPAHRRLRPREVRMSRSTRVRRVARFAVLALRRCCSRDASPALCDGPHDPRRRIDLVADRDRAVASRREPAGPVQVNYKGVGSTTGRQFFASGRSISGVSEIPFLPDGFAPSRSFKYLPIVAGGTSMMYNLRTPSGNQIRNLKLSPPNDRRDLHRQDHEAGRTSGSRPDYGSRCRTPDRVLVRSDGSGTSSQFSAYIAAAMEPVAERLQRVPPVEQPHVVLALRSTQMPSSRDRAEGLRRDRQLRRQPRLG